MFTGLLLICLASNPQDCTVSASPMFFPTVERCVATNEEAKAILEDRGLIVKEQTCIAWGTSV